MLKGDSLETLMMSQMVGTYIIMFATLCLRLVLGDKNRTQIIDMQRCG